MVLVLLEGTRVPERGALAPKGCLPRQGGAVASPLSSLPASPSDPSSGECGSWPGSHLRSFQVLIVQREGTDESFLLQKARRINQDRLTVAACRAVPESMAQWVSGTSATCTVGIAMFPGPPGGSPLTQRVLPCSVGLLGAPHSRSGCCRVPWAS